MRMPTDMLVDRQPGDPPTAFVRTEDGLYVRLSCLPFAAAVLIARAAVGRPTIELGGELVLPIDEALQYAEGLNAARPYEDADLIIATMKRYQAAFRAAVN